jgi:hypothetical protein
MSDGGDAHKIADVLHVLGVHKTAGACAYYTAKNKALLLQEEAIRARRWCLEVVYKVGSPLHGY